MTNRDSALTGQVIKSAAQVYEEFFVPALFGQWSPRVCDAAGIGTDDAVLDVGTGTGTLARTIASRVSGLRSVSAIDVNEPMLAIAEQADPAIDWHLGRAEDLPFDDRSFDVVVSQFALMFFEDQRRGLAEMARVLRPGGTVAIATWAEIDRSPGYSAMVKLLRRLFGDRAADALLAPYTLGSADKVADLLSDSFVDVAVSEVAGIACFESIEAWVHTDVRGWTLAELINDAQYGRLLEAAELEFADMCDDAGRVSFAAPALIATGTTPITD